MPFLNKPHKSSNDLEALRQDIETDVHTTTISELIKKLGVDPKKGLSASRARELLALNGPNALTPPKKTSEFAKICRCCCGGFSVLIWVKNYK